MTFYRWLKIQSLDDIRKHEKVLGFHARPVSVEEYLTHPAEDFSRVWNAMLP
jgi:hypothetical protein